MRCISKRTTLTGNAVDHSITQRSCLRGMRTPRPRKQVFFLAALLAASAGTLAGGSRCRVVEGDRILMSDLAAAIPEFATASSDVQVSFSPRTGATRIFTPTELQRLARAHGVTLQLPPSVCFVRSSQLLDPEKLLGAMAAALPQASIELLDYCRATVPFGEIEFTKNGLIMATPGHFEEPVLWKGVVRNGSSAFPIWVRVKATVRREVVIAAEPLKMGEAIRESQVTRESKIFPPLYKDFVEDLAEVVGAIPRVGFEKGQILRPAPLRKADTVKKGSRVAVTALAGEAQLNFEATAESGGNTGDTVTVRNPMNGRHFKGRVESAGKVVVE